MAIHRWGEGVWARTIAIAIAATFVIWGAFDFYNVPKAASEIVKGDDVLTDDRLERLIEQPKTDRNIRALLTIRSGFANQDVGEALVGAKVGDNIATNTRGTMAKAGDVLTKAQVDAIKEAGITRIPVEDRFTRTVDKTLIGAILKTVVMAAPAAKVVIPANTVVADAGHLTKLLADAAGAVPAIDGNNPWPNALQAADGSAPARPWTNLADLQIGDKVMIDITGEKRAATVFEPGKSLIEDDIKTLREAGITTVEVERAGVLALNDGAKAYAAFYFTAGESRSEKTWWTQQVWEIPLFGWSLTGGGIACMIVMVVLLVLSWNYLNRPKFVDLLIETQFEMKKVSWPKGRELASSSIVVMAFIVFVASWLAVADYVFLWLATFIGVYGGK